MDQVFAPWRIDWVERETHNEDIEGCVFCAFADHDRSRDRERRVVARGGDAYVLLNNYPYGPGHAMVIPEVHTGEYHDIGEEALLGHARLKQRTFAALEAALAPDGFNAGLNLGGGPAGGSIDDHLHTHVVPRWEGDTNFMPVVADTQVIVEAVGDTYDRLRGTFADQSGATVADEDAAVELEL